MLFNLSRFFFKFVIEFRCSQISILLFFSPPHHKSPLFGRSLLLEMGFHPSISVVLHSRDGLGEIRGGGCQTLSSALTLKWNILTQVMMASAPSSVVKTFQIAVNILVWKEE